MDPQQFQQGGYSMSQQQQPHPSQLQQQQLNGAAATQNANSEAVKQEAPTPGQASGQNDALNNAVNSGNASGGNMSGFNFNNALGGIGAPGAFQGNGNVPFLIGASPFQQQLSALTGLTGGSNQGRLPMGLSSGNQQQQAQLQALQQQQQLNASQQQTQQQQQMTRQRQQQQQQMTTAGNQEAPANNGTGGAGQQFSFGQMLNQQQLLNQQQQLAMAAAQNPLMAATSPQLGFNLQQLQQLQLAQQLFSAGGLPPGFNFGALGGGAGGMQPPGQAPSGYGGGAAQGMAPSGIPQGQGGFSPPLPGFNMPQQASMPTPGMGNAFNSLAGFNNPGGLMNANMRKDGSDTSGELGSSSNSGGQDKAAADVKWAEPFAAKAKKEPPFPLKLHQILSNPEFSECICWNAHGKSWRILKPPVFEQVVIPLYFRHAKYASFMRQVNGWGFKRIVSGNDHNSYYHELFVRDYPQLCLKMKRIKKGGEAEKAKRDSDGEDDEDAEQKIEEMSEERDDDVPTPSAASFGNEVGGSNAPSGSMAQGLEQQALQAQEGAMSSLLQSRIQGQASQGQSFMGSLVGLSSASNSGLAGLFNSNQAAVSGGVLKEGGAPSAIGGAQTTDGASGQLTSPPADGSTATGPRAAAASGILSSKELMSGPAGSSAAGTPAPTDATSGTSQPQEAANPPGGSTGPRFPSVDSSTFAKLQEALAAAGGNNLAFLQQQQQLVQQQTYQDAAQKVTSLQDQQGLGRVLGAPPQSLMPQGFDFLMGGGPGAALLAAQLQAATQPPNSAQSNSGAAATASNAASGNTASAGMGTSLGSTFGLAQQGQANNNNSAMLAQLIQQQIRASGQSGPSAQQEEKRDNNTGANNEDGNDEDDRDEDDDDEDDDDNDEDDDEDDDDDNEDDDDDNEDDDDAGESA